MPCVVRDGVQVYYDDTGGDGFPVIFTHGFASGSGLWAAQVPVVRAAGKFRMISWDMRGHAKSDSPDDAAMYSKQHQVDDMKAVLDACKVERAIFVGHSMGGYDNMLFYHTYPQYVHAMVLYGTGPGFGNEKGRLGWNRTAGKLASKYEERGLEALVGSDTSKGHRSARGLALSCRGSFAQREDDKLFMSFSEGPLVAAKRLKHIAVPVGIICGERDRGFLRASQMMAAKIPGAQLTLIPNAGHMACEKNPAAFNEALLACLAKFGVAAMRPRL